MDNSTASDGLPFGAGPPPSSDYHVERSVFGWGIAMSILSATAVAARFYTRARIRHVLGVEDYFILVAFLLATGNGVAMMMEAVYGLGNHIMELPPETIKLQLRAAWVSVLFYQLSLSFSKASVCLLYVRLFTYHIARIAAWALLAVVVVYTTYGTISTFMLCIPLQAWWDMSITDKKCQTGLEGMWALIFLHIITDFLIFALPIPVVWRMKLPKRQKIGVLFVLALGFFVCLVSIIRAIFVQKAMDEGAADPSHAYIAIANWSIVEVNTAVVVPCLIVLKPLIAKLWPGVFGRSSRGSDGLEGGSAGQDRVLTIGGSGPTSRANAHIPPPSVRSGGAFSLTTSRTEKNSLDDVESTAGASDGPRPPLKQDGVERAESAGSLHHQYLAQEALETRRQASQKET